MSMIDGLQALVDGVFQTATMVHARKPGVRRVAARKAEVRAQTCTPCAAGAYAHGLRSLFTPKGPPSR